MKIYIYIEDAAELRESEQYTQTVTVTKNNGGLPAKYSAQEVIVVKSKEALMEELNKPQSRTSEIPTARAQGKLPTITASASAVVTKEEDKDKGKEEASKE